MSPRNPDPWGDYRRDRDDISVAAAFFMTFALLGLVAWVVFFGTGWIVPAASGIFPQSATRTPAPYVAAITGTTGVTAVAGASATNPTTAAAPPRVPAAPTPLATATASPNVAKLRLGNTGGDGVFLRRSAGDSELWIPWPDNTVVDNLNERQEAGGRVYVKVRDPRGNVGWMPAEYLIPD